jgi:hypothetical protein
MSELIILVFLYVKLKIKIPELMILMFLYIKLKIKKKMLKHFFLTTFRLGWVFGLTYDKSKFDNPF